MNRDKVHIPGELDMLTRVQRCIRCHARIDSNRFWPNREPSAWAVGVPVLSRRTGMKRLTEAEATQYRPCGRQS